MSIFAEGETKLKNGTKVNQSSMVTIYNLWWVSVKQRVKHPTQKYICYEYDR